MNLNILLVYDSKIISNYKNNCIEVDSIYNNYKLQNTIYTIYYTEIYLRLHFCSKALKTSAEKFF